MVVRCFNRRARKGHGAVLTGLTGWTGFQTQLTAENEGSTEVNGSKDCTKANKGNEGEWLAQDRGSSVERRGSRGTDWPVLAELGTRTNLNCVRGLAADRNVRAPDT